MSKVGANRKSTKAGIDIDEARRKREDNIIELRKNKRDENLQKKRQTFTTPQYAAEDSTKGGPAGQRVGRTKICIFKLHMLSLSYENRWKRCL